MTGGDPYATHCHPSLSRSHLVDDEVTGVVAPEHAHLEREREVTVYDSVAASSSKEWGAGSPSPTRE